MMTSLEMQPMGTDSELGVSAFQSELHSRNSGIVSESEVEYHRVLDWERSMRTDRTPRGRIRLAAFHCWRLLFRLQLPLYSVTLIITTALAFFFRAQEPENTLSEALVYSTLAGTLVACIGLVLMILQCGCGGFIDPLSRRLMINQFRFTSILAYLIIASLALASALLLARVESVCNGTTPCTFAALSRQNLGNATGGLGKNLTDSS